MKKLFLLFILLISLFANATIRTVSNQASGGAQFNTIQSAVDASANGDSIYVHGSSNNYASFDVVDKKLTIIGPGWAPDKNTPFQVIITGCNLRNSPATGSPSGTELQGLIFVQQVNLVALFLGNDLPFGNLRIIRCQFNANIAFNTGTSNNLFEGCIFLGVIGFTTNTNTGVSNVLFQNNLFFTNVFAQNNIITGLFDNISNVQFDHNLFYTFTSNSTGVSIKLFDNCRFLTLSNNIFIKRDVPLGLSNSTFNNNITFLCGPVGDAPWTVNGNINAGGNVAGQSPQMVDEAAVESGTFSGLLNFTIPAGPANNAGSDGKDMGLLYDPSGSLNWTNSRNSRFPRIFSMNITTPTVTPGSNVSVTVEARKSN